MPYALALAGTCGNQVFQFLEIKGKEYRLTAAAKITAQIASRVFFTSLSILEALFFSLLCVSVSPLLLIAPKKYADLTNRTRAAFYAIRDNAYGTIHKKKPTDPSQQKSLLNRLYQFGFEHKGLIAAIGVTVLVCAYFWYAKGTPHSLDEQTEQFVKKTSSTASPATVDPAPPSNPSETTVYSPFFENNLNNLPNPTKHKEGVVQKVINSKNQIDQTLYTAFKYIILGLSIGGGVIYCGSNCYSPRKREIGTKKIEKGGQRSNSTGIGGRSPTRNTINPGTHTQTLDLTSNNLVDSNQLNASIENSYDDTLSVKKDFNKEAWLAKVESTILHDPDNLNKSDFLADCLAHPQLNQTDKINLVTYLSKRFDLKSQRNKILTMSMAVAVIDEMWQTNNDLNTKDEKLAVLNLVKERESCEITQEEEDIFLEAVKEVVISFEDTVSSDLSAEEHKKYRLSAGIDVVVKSMNLSQEQNDQKSLVRQLSQKFSVVEKSSRRKRSENIENVPSNKKLKKSLKKKKKNKAKNNKIEKSKKNKNKSKKHPSNLKAS